MTDRADIAREARDVIAAARAVVAEWAEEGIESFDRDAARASTAAPMEAPESAAPAPSQDTPVESAATPMTTREQRPSRDAEVGAPPVASEAEPPAPSNARLTLEQVRAELGDCTRCGLHNGRQHIVFGDGDPHADILFVGEGPGQSEDEQGLPFVGRAGELLTQMIEKGMGLARSDVYICNIVKCRPPRNRTPLPDEVAACRPFLDGQIEAVNPKVIVALGKPAAGLLLGREVAITRIRGTWHDYQGIPLMPTLHPAYVLRQYTPENRRAVWDDLKAVLARVESS